MLFLLGSGVQPGLPQWGRSNAGANSKKLHHVTDTILIVYDGR